MIGPGGGLDGGAGCDGDGAILIIARGQEGEDPPLTREEGGFVERGGGVVDGVGDGSDNCIAGG